MKRTLVVTVLAAGLLPPLCSATIIYVDDDVPPAGNGPFWPTAYTFLQDAPSAAAADANIADIHVAQRTYHLRGSTDLILGPSGLLGNQPEATPC